MRGQILGVHDGRGVLLSLDDRRLEFPLSEWRSAGAPAAGLAVDFVEEDGQARAVFAVPHPDDVRPSSHRPRSSSFVLGAISVGCLALGFFIPLLPMIAGFLIGVIGAGRAKEEGDETGLLLSRIGWIGSISFLIVGTVALFAALLFFGGLFGAWATFAPTMDWH